MSSGRFNILVTTYEFIMRDRARLCRLDWRYIIIDEAQRLKVGERGGGAGGEESIGRMAGGRGVWWGSAALAARHEGLS